MHNISHHKTTTKGWWAQ